MRCVLPAASCLALVLTACGTSASPPPAMAPAQTAADAASTAYATCVEKAAAALDAAADQPAVLAERALKACAAERATARAKVGAAQEAGGMDPTTAPLVAERSLRVADDELRDRANSTIEARKLAKGG